MSLLVALSGPGSARAHRAAAGNPSVLCPSDAPASDQEVVVGTLGRLESEAETAEAARDHLRAALLLLQAERHVPRCAAAARANRIDRAAAALRSAADEATFPSVYFELAVAAIEAFLSDLHSAFGDQAAIPEAERIRAELAVLRESAEQARRGPQASPASKQPLVRPDPRPAPLLPLSERSVHIRRERRLAVGVGVGAALTAVSATTGLILRFQLIEGGALHRRIQAAAVASGQDSDPSNDVPHAPSTDICLALRTEVRDNAGVESLCARHRGLLYASTGSFIAAGGFAVATAVFATMLAHHRRGPVARALRRGALSLLGGPTPGGFGLALGWRG